MPYILPPHNKEIDEKFHQLNLINIEYVIYWWKYFEAISDIPGDIVECGIGRGRSLLIISALNYFVNDEGLERTIFAYDSFEGFPEPTKEDMSSRIPHKGEWSGSPSGKYKYSADFTRLVLSEAGLPVDESMLKIKKGYFSDSLVDHPNRPIALLHIDGDLYQSYKDTLHYLYDKVVKGGVIVFDDFQSEIDEEERWPGSRLAVKEFLGEKFKDLKVSIRGTYYYIKD